MARDAQLSGVKIRGLTAASATIATVTVSLYVDGTWDFVGADGVTRIYDGRDPAVNALLTDIFTGSGGLTTGQKLFGNGGEDYS